MGSDPQSYLQFQHEQEHADCNRRIKELEAKNQRLKADLLCDICLGKSTPGSTDCACGGTGSALEVRNYTRVQLVRAEQHIEELEQSRLTLAKIALDAATERDEARAALAEERARLADEAISYERVFFYIQKEGQVHRYHGPSILRERDEAKAALAGERDTNNELAKRVVALENDLAKERARRSVMVKALTDIAEGRTKCIYSEDSAFRSGSHMAFVQSADLAAAAIDAARNEEP